MNYSVVIAVITNILVITVLCLRPKKLRSTDKLIMVLAVSDILFSLLVHTLLIVNMFGADITDLYLHPAGEKFDRHGQ